jgi:hypothetical protein
LKAAEREHGAAVKLQRNLTRIRGNYQNDDESEMEMEVGQLIGKARESEGINLRWTGLFLEEEVF